MSRRRALGAAVLAAAVLLVVAIVVISSGSSGSGTSTTTSGTTSTSGPPVPPPVPGVQYGASVNYLFNDSQDFNATQVDRQLRVLRLTGATLARTDALWEASEPSPPTHGVHHYQWAFDDRIAATLSENGLEWLPILDYSAPWAQSVPGQDHSAPRSAAEYAAYAGAFAARYGPGGTFWQAHPGLASAPVETYEIWNEPDNGEFWSPKPDAARYADLYLAARKAIRSSQPAANVIIGGLTNPVSFLPAMLAARPQLRGAIDGVGIHPYGRPLVVLSRIRSARSTLVNLRMAAVPLYATEFGWTTEPPGALDYAPARLRPGYIHSTLRALGHINCGLAAAVLYTWVTPERNAQNPQDWYGVNSLTRGGRTADVSAFAAGIEDARGAGASTDLCPVG